MFCTQTAFNASLESKEYEIWRNFWTICAVPETIVINFTLTCIHFHSMLILFNSYRQHQFQCQLLDTAVSSYILLYYQYMNASEKCYHRHRLHGNNISSSDTSFGHLVYYTKSITYNTHNIVRHLNKCVPLYHKEYNSLQSRFHNIISE